MRKNHLQVVFLIRRRADSPFVRQHRVASLQAAGIVFRRHPVGSSSLSLGDDTLRVLVPENDKTALYRTVFHFQAPSGLAFRSATSCCLTAGRWYRLPPTSCRLFLAITRRRYPPESLCPKTTKPPFAGRFFIFRRRADSNR